MDSRRFRDFAAVGGYGSLRCQRSAGSLGGGEDAGEAEVEAGVVGQVAELELTLGRGDGVSMTADLLRA